MRAYSLRRRLAGITLVELMVTIAVLAIALTLAVPSLTDLIRSNRVTSQTNEFVALLHLARTDAIRRNPIENASVLVDLDLTASGWSAFVRPPFTLGEEDEPPAGCPDGTIRCLTRQGVLLNLSQVGEIRFNNRGYLVDDSGDLAPGAQLDLRHLDCQTDRHARRIIITATGQVAAGAGTCNE